MFSDTRLIERSAECNSAIFTTSYVAGITNLRYGRRLMKQPLLLAGPTAVGKSEIAMCLAEKLGGEIVSVDSMQVYRGLDIGTAKPTPPERARLPHHLIDVVD